MHCSILVHSSEDVNTVRLRTLLVILPVFRYLLIAGTSDEDVPHNCNYRTNRTWQVMGFPSFKLREFVKSGVEDTELPQ